MSIKQTRIEEKIAALEVRMDIALPSDRKLFALT
jgi:hypothetical protein